MVRLLFCGSSSSARDGGDGGGDFLADRATADGGSERSSLAAHGGRDHVALDSSLSPPASPKPAATSQQEEHEVSCSSPAAAAARDGDDGPPPEAAQAVVDETPAPARGSGVTDDGSRSDARAWLGGHPDPRDGRRWMTRTKPPRTTARKLVSEVCPLACGRVGLRTVRELTQHLRNVHTRVGSRGAPPGREHAQLTKYMRAHHVWWCARHNACKCAVASGLPNGDGWYSVKYGACAGCGTEATPAYNADLAKALHLRLRGGANICARSDGELILASHQNGASAPNLKQAKKPALFSTERDLGVTAPAPAHSREPQSRDATTLEHAENSLQCKNVLSRALLHSANVQNNAKSKILARVPRTAASAARAKIAQSSLTASGRSGKARSEDASALAVEKFEKAPGVPRLSRTAASRAREKIARCYSTPLAPARPLCQTAAALQDAVHSSVRSLCAVSRAEAAATSGELPPVSGPRRASVRRAAKSARWPHDNNRGFLGSSADLARTLTGPPARGTGGKAAAVPASCFDLNADPPTATAPICENTTALSPPPANSREISGGLDASARVSPGTPTTAGNILQAVSAAPLSSAHNSPATPTAAGDILQLQADAPVPSSRSSPSRGAYVHAYAVAASPLPTQGDKLIDRACAVPPSPLPPQGEDSPVRCGGSPVSSPPVRGDKIIVNACVPSSPLPVKGGDILVCSAGSALSSPPDQGDENHSAAGPSCPSTPPMRGDIVVVKSGLVRPSSPPKREESNVIDAVGPCSSPSPPRGDDNVVHDGSPSSSSPPARGDTKLGDSVASSPSPLPAEGDDVPGDTGDPGVPARDNLQGDDGCSCTPALATSASPTPRTTAVGSPSAPAPLPNVKLAGLLCPPTDGEAEAWADALRTETGLPVLRVAGVQVTEDDLGCLRGGAWLNDSVLNAFFALLNASHRASRTSQGVVPAARVHVFSTFLHARLVCPDYAFARVRRWTRAAGVNLADLDTMLVPVHVSGNHWALVSLNSDARSVVYYDSARSLSHDRVAVLKNLRRWLHDALMADGQDEKAQRWNVLKWRLAVSVSMPQQTDGAACGIFVCAAAVSLSEGLPPRAAQRNVGTLRTRIGLSLLAAAGVPTEAPPCTAVASAVKPPPSPSPMKRRARRGRVVRPRAVARRRLAGAAKLAPAQNVNSVKSSRALARAVTKRATSLPAAVPGDKTGEATGVAPSPPPLRMKFKTALLSPPSAASHGDSTPAGGSNFTKCPAFAPGTRQSPDPSKELPGSPVFEPGLPSQPPKSSAFAPETRQSPKMLKALPGSPVFEPSLPEKAKTPSLAPPPPPASPIMVRGLAVVPASSKKTLPIEMDDNLFSPAPARPEAMPDQAPPAAPTLVLDTPPPPAPASTLPIVNRPGALPERSPSPVRLPSPLPPTPSRRSGKRVVRLYKGKPMHELVPPLRSKRTEAKLRADRELPELDVVFMTHVPVLTHVPTSSRHLVRDALTAVMWDFGQATDTATATNALRRFFVFAKCVLAAPVVSRNAGKPNATSLTKLVNDRLERWHAGDYGALWKMAARGASQNSALRISVEETARRNAARAVRLAHEGAYSRAAQSLQSHGVCEASDAVHAVLKQKHPQTAAATDGTFPWPPEADLPPTLPHVPFKPSDVRAAVELFPKATGAGGSGLSPAHLLTLLRTPCNKRETGFLAALTKMCNTLAAGQAPPEMAQWIAAAPVVPLKKRDGGVRPIAIGESVRRLVGKLWMRRLRDRVAAHLLPSQVGVAVRGGAEATVHACRRLADKLGDDDGFALLQLDFKNAFNLVSRPAFLRVVRQHFPELHAWADYTYGTTSRPWLWSGDERWSSATGVQQGDPLGPMLYALAVGELMADLREKLATWAKKENDGNDKTSAAPLALFYCDDGVFVAKHAVLARVLKYFATPLARSYGLHLRADKCILWWPSSPPALARAAYPPDVKQTYGGGTHVLQAPVGDVKFVEESVVAQVRDMKPLLDAVVDLGDAHVSLTLLRSCFGACRLSFTLRVVPSTLAMRGAILFDAQVEAALRRMLGGALPRDTYRELQLPLNTNKPTFGVGLLSAESCASAAFLCSLSLCAGLLRTLVPSDIDMSLDADQWAPVSHADLSERCGSAVTPTLAKFESDEQRQRDVVRLVHGKVIADIPVGDERTQAMRSLLSLPGSKDWLKCAPTPGLGTHISDRAFRLWLQYWCRIPLFEEDTPCPRPKCSGHLDAFGDHLLHCQHGVAVGNAPMVWRHDSQLRLLAADLKRVARHPQLEYRAPMSHKSRPDIKCLGAEGGADYIELSIVNPLSNSSRTRLTRNKPAVHLSILDSRKRKQHRELMEGAPAGSRLLVFGMTTLGGWAKEARDYMIEVARVNALRTEATLAWSISVIFARHAVRLVQSNVLCLTEGINFG